MKDWRIVKWVAFEIKSIIIIIIKGRRHIQLNNFNTKSNFTLIAH